MKVYSRIVTKIFNYVCNNIIKKQKQKKQIIKFYNKKN